MKPLKVHAILLPVLLSLCLCAAAMTQTYEYSKQPVKNGPFVHVIDEPVNLIVQADTVYALGRWVASDSSQPLAGPSVSEINCDRLNKSCHEQIANILAIGDAFSLDPDSADYRETRWNKDELVAENPGVQASLPAGIAICWEC